MGMRGVTWLSDQVSAAGKWLDEVIDSIQARIDAYLEEEKQQGGFSGFVARSTDFIGDDVLNLW